MFGEREDGRTSRSDGHIQVIQVVQLIQVIERIQVIEGLQVMEVIEGIQVLLLMRAHLEVIRAHTGHTGRTGPHRSSGPHKSYRSYRHTGQTPVCCVSMNCMRCITFAKFGVYDLHDQIREYLGDRVPLYDEIGRGRVRASNERALTLALNPAEQWTRMASLEMEMASIPDCVRDKSQISGGGRDTFGAERICDGQEEG